MPRKVSTYHYPTREANKDDFTNPTGINKAVVHYLNLTQDANQNESTAPPGTKPAVIRLDKLEELKRFLYDRKKVPCLVFGIRHDSKTKEILARKICKVKDFRAWADTEDSAICILSGYCKTPVHCYGCDFLSFTLGDEIFFTKSTDLSNRHNFHEIHLEILHYESIGMTCAFLHPSYLVTKLLLRLADTLCDEGKGTKSINVEVDPFADLPQEIKFHALLLTLVQTVRQFRKHFPDKSLFIFIHHMSPAYPWLAELAVFLHVLTQLTRQQMPHRFKVVISGDGIFTTKCTSTRFEYGLWYYLNTILYNQAEDNSRGGFHSETPDEQKSFLYERILFLDWDEVNSKFIKYDPMIPRRTVVGR